MSFDAFSKFVSDWTAENKDILCDTYEIELTDVSWPIAQVDTIQDKNSLLGVTESDEKFMLLMKKRTNKGQVLYVGVNTIFFETY